MTLSTKNTGNWRVKSFNILATYKKAEDLINIGAYVQGSNPEIDYAITMIHRVNAFLKQNIDEKIDFNQTKDQMRALFASSDKLSFDLLTITGLKSMAKKAKLDILEITIDEKTEDELRMR